MRPCAVFGDLPEHHLHRVLALRERRDGGAGAWRERQRGVAVVVELGAQLGHAVHVDAILAVHAKTCRQLVIEVFHRNFSRLPLEATGVQQAAARRQLKFEIMIGSLDWASLFSAKVMLCSSASYELRSVIVKCLSSTVSSRDIVSAAVFATPALPFISKYCILQDSEYTL